jgi:excinuclease ABC subunit B
MTDSMRHAFGETERRRKVQEAYNLEHGITPASIIKHIDDVLSSVYERDYVTVAKVADEREQYRTQAELNAAIAGLERDMKEAAANLEFERAAAIRDRLRRLRNPDLVTIAEGDRAPGGPGLRQADRADRIRAGEPADLSP